MKRWVSEDDEIEEGESRPVRHREDHRRGEYRGNDRRDNRRDDRRGDYRGYEGRDDRRCDRSNDRFDERRDDRRNDRRNERPEKRRNHRPDDQINERSRSRSRSEEEPNHAVRHDKDPMKHLPTKKEEELYVIKPRRDDPNFKHGSLVSRMREHLEEEEKEQINFDVTGLLLEDMDIKGAVRRKYVIPMEAKRPIDKGWRFFVFKGDNDQEQKIVKMYKGDHFVFGTDPKVAHIVLMHPTISREHAVVQFKMVDSEKDIRPFLMDLKSSNGTLLNGDLIEPLEYYELNEQDVVRFAMSNRDYVLVKDESVEMHDMKFGGEEYCEDFLNKKVSDIIHHSRGRA